MAAFSYERLYRLQDVVLSQIAAKSAGFYLTGGTALSRFYLGHRYSDDLDFFTHDVLSFSDAFRAIHGLISSFYPAIALEVDARDFKRLRILDDGTELKVDFVADRIARTGMPVSIRNVYVDTVRNILGNKLCAILGRDEGRDIADLIHISLERRFTWQSVLADVSRKEAFQTEELVMRLDSFPIEALSRVPFVESWPLDVYAGYLAAIRGDIWNAGENTLAGSEKPFLEKSP